MGQKVDTPDFAVAKIAVRQHGAVSRSQLEGAGLGARAIRNRVARGQLHRLYRGVYGVGHRGLPSLSRLLTTYRDNVPTTTVARTIEDLRASSLIPPRLLRRAIRQAELKGYRLEGIETDGSRG